LETGQPFASRRAGILLHPSSLPGPRGTGDLGGDAYRFVDFLAAAGQSVWQVLPLGPTHDGGSPYQCLSVHAGDARLISLERLVEAGWLDADDLRAAGDAYSYGDDGVWARALRGFSAHAEEGMRAGYGAFLREQREWLADYALFVALREESGRAAWTEWPAPLRDRDPAALSAARERHRTVIERVGFEQFLFHHQWHGIRRYANERGVLLFGDMPIFVAHDSVDVWVDRRLFNLDGEGRCAVVAGVPPDYFSATGQRWGNPHYRWDVMAGDGYRWWIRRLGSHLAMFDLVRIDHFRGFESFWEIPADSADAIAGRWVEGPREALFDALVARFGSLPVVAEDLGMITPEVYALRDRYHLPGMKILQFAFDGTPDNPYLPHNHLPLSVVYTGTHDNDTTLGWYQSLEPRARAYADEYLGHPGEEMPWPLVRAAMASTAALAIVPMQDALALDGTHRMNVPGTTEGNWRWRFGWEQVPEDLDARLLGLARLYGRIPPA
jgi:4-alpha-glucanotransferase